MFKLVQATIPKALAAGVVFGTKACHDYAIGDVTCSALSLFAQSPTKVFNASEKRKNALLFLD
jgi:hypothetical protein